MLTVAKITGGSATAVASYFLDLPAQKKRGDYYSGPDGNAVERAGRWVGGLAARLGLTGACTEDELLRLLDGRHPRTGERLLYYNRRDRVLAHDLTFSAPKSVSAIWAVTDERTQAAIEQAQEDAADEALDYIVRRLPLVRRGDGGHTLETAAEVAAVGFLHTTSRQTHEQALRSMPPDPQLHTHMLLAFARRHDGRIVAINSAALLCNGNRQEIESVYHAALAARLQGLGFTVRPQTGRGRRYFEIDGVPTTLIADWSSRSAEIAGASAEWIEDFRATHGRDPSVVELREIAVRHREAKGKPHSSPRLFWRVVGRVHGFTEDTVATLQRDGAGLPDAGDARAALIGELLGADGLTREHATFTMPTLRTQAMIRGAGRLTVDEIERAVAELIRNDDVVRVDDGVWTTQGDPRVGAARPRLAAGPHWPRHGTGGPARPVGGAAGPAGARGCLTGRRAARCLPRDARCEDVGRDRVRPAPAKEPCSALPGTSGDPRAAGCSRSRSPAPPRNASPRRSAPAPRRSPSTRSACASSTTGSTPSAMTTSSSSTRPG